MVDSKSSLIANIKAHALEKREWLVLLQEKLGEPNVRNILRTRPPGQEIGQQHIIENVFDT